MVDWTSSLAPDGHRPSHCGISRSVCLGALGSVTVRGTAWLGRRNSRRLELPGSHSGNRWILYLLLVYSRALPRGAQRLAGRKNAALPNAVLLAYIRPLSLQL